MTKARNIEEFRKEFGNSIFTFKEYRKYRFIYEHGGVEVQVGGERDDLHQFAFSAKMTGEGLIGTTQSILTVFRKVQEDYVWEEYLDHPSEEASVLRIDPDNTIPLGAPGTKAPSQKLEVKGAQQPSEGA